MATRERRVGVRELRQNLSVYLRRVYAGETLEVTERGQPVALLTPAHARSSAIRRLVSSGRASSPSGELLDLGAPPKNRTIRRGALGRALDRERDDRF